MRRIKIADLMITCTLAITLTGCGVFGPFRNNTAKIPALNGQTRVFYGPCVISFEAEKNESAIANAIVPEIISQGLNRIGIALRQAAAPEPNTSIGHVNIDQSASKISPCIQFINGSCSSSGTGDMSKYLSLPQSVNQRLATENMRDAGIFLAKRPNTFIELRLRASGDGSALAVAPTHVEYRSNDKNRSTALVLLVSFHPPGKSYDGSQAKSTTVTLGDSGGDVIETYLIDLTQGINAWKPPIESPWFPRPDSGVIKALPKGKAAPTRPMTLTVGLTETKSANEFLVALADIFDSSKDTLQEEAEKLLLKSKREAAELTELQVFSTNQTAYITSLAKAQRALLSYCLSSDTTDTVEGAESRITKSSEAQIAQLEANLAATKAGLALPYSNLISVSADAIPDPCP